MSIIRRYMDYMDRLDAARRDTSRGLSLSTALFCAVALGYVLGSGRFGHGQAVFAVFFAAMLLSNLPDLVNQRWLRFAFFNCSLVLLIISGVMLATSSEQRSQTAPGKNLFAGAWKGTLHFESQDSYRGTNAKREHRSEADVWVFEISPEEKTIAYHRADWNGPKNVATVVHKNNHTIAWHESTQASAALLPTVFYDQHGGKIGTGVGVRADFDADWTMDILSERSANILCSANREDIYARITDSRATGTLEKVK